jgi:hypothetical protein
MRELASLTALEGGIFQSNRHHTHPCKGCGEPTGCILTANEASGGKRRLSGPPPKALLPDPLIVVGRLLLA